MSDTEYKKHTSRSWTFEASYGKAHFTELDIYDPQLFLENTPLGTATDKYHTRAVHKGVSIVYSHEQFTPTTEYLMLSVSEGTKETQEEVVERFREFLGSATGQYDWTHVSSLGIYERNMYIWEVKTTKQ